MFMKKQHTALTSKRTLGCLVVVPQSFLYYCLVRWPFCKRLFVASCFSYVYVYVYVCLCMCMCMCVVHVHVKNNLYNAQSFFSLFFLGYMGMASALPALRHGGASGLLSLSSRLPRLCKCREDTPNSPDTELLSLNTFSLLSSAPQAADPCDNVRNCWLGGRLPVDKLLGGRAFWVVLSPACEFLWLCGCLCLCLCVCVHMCVCARANLVHFDIQVASAVVTVAPHRYRQPVRYLGMVLFSV